MKKKYKNIKFDNNDINTPWHKICYHISTLNANQMNDILVASHQMVYNYILKTILFNDNLRQRFNDVPYCIYEFILTKDLSQKKIKAVNNLSFTIGEELFYIIEKNT